MSPGSIMPRYPWLAKSHVDAEVTPAKIRAMQTLGVLRPLEDYRAKDGESFNIAAVKYAVSLRGQDFGPCRAPQRRLTPAEQDELQRIVEPLLER